MKLQYLFSKFGAVRLCTISLAVVMAACDGDSTSGGGHGFVNHCLEEFRDVDATGGRLFAVRNSCEFTINVGEHLGVISTSFINAFRLQEDEVFSQDEKFQSLTACASPSRPVLLLDGSAGTTEFACE